MQNRNSQTVTAATALLLLWISATAQADDLKHFLFQALSSPTGSAEGVLTDDKISDFFRQQTRSREPVKVVVATLRHFNQEGCSRLAVTLGQDNVPLKTGGEAPFSMRYELNLCRDGSPPIEVVDLSKFK